MSLVMDHNVNVCKPVMNDSVENVMTINSEKCSNIVIKPILSVVNPYIMLQHPTAPIAIADTVTQKCCKECRNM